MKRILIIFILIPLFQWAQLPASRQVDWTRAGSSTSLVNLPVKQVINVVNDLSFDNTGVSDVSAALNTAISSTNDNTLFYFPPGDYLFTQQVNVKSGCVIKGKSSTDTKFKFNLSGSLVHCFNINGSTSGNRVNVTGGMS